jgi:hypothetical protein
MTSSFFKDMFSLPPNPLTVDQSEPIFIDETGEAIALLINDLTKHREQAALKGPRHDIAVLLLSSFMLSSAFTISSLPPHCTLRNTTYRGKSR